MPMPSIDIRFVTSNDSLSEFIRLQAGVAMPFTPSHTEARTKDGAFYIGAHLQGGILRRPVGYDDKELMTLPDASKSSRVVSIPCTQQQEDAFYAFVESCVGESYDWKGILGFVLTEVHLHDYGRRFCSALMAAGLRAKGCEVFRWPMTVPFHHISPRDLFLILSIHVEIPH